MMEELRLHVDFGKVIFLQYKKRQSEVAQTPDQKLIRNHGNGWVFCPRPVEDAPADSAAQAVLAVKALCLDFGAVDIVVGKKDNMPYVLEVNTAPGIESPTLVEAYKAAFTRELVPNVRALGG
jgi:glutathione synthase/RimK-type ligase-like ATP-grasp enzyme